MNKYRIMQKNGRCFYVPPAKYKWAQRNSLKNLRPATEQEIEIGGEEYMSLAILSMRSSILKERKLKEQSAKPKKEEQKEEPKPEPKTKRKTRRKKTKPKTEDE